MNNLLHNAVSLALEKGLFEIVKTDGISEYGCQGIVCQNNGLNDNQFYFTNSSVSHSYSGFAPEYVEYVGKENIINEIVDVLEEMTEQEEFYNEVCGYLADMLFCARRYRKDDIADYLEGIIEEVRDKEYTYER